MGSLILYLNYLQKASSYIPKDNVSIGSHKVKYRSIVSSVCQVLPLECTQSIFLNLNAKYEAEYEAYLILLFQSWYKLPLRSLLVGRIFR